MADVEFEWYENYGADRGKGSIGDLVSHMPGVRIELRVTATKIYMAAQIELAVHHKHANGAKITMTSPPIHKLDFYVWLKDMDPGGEGRETNRQDRSAMSIEFGWTQTHAYGKKLKRKRKHDGLHILGKAMKSL